MAQHNRSGSRPKKIALLYRGPQGAGRDDFTSFVPSGFFNLLKSLLLAGYDATLYNLSAIPKKALPDTLAAMRADAYLLSSFFGSHLEAFHLATLLKKTAPRAPVILGGPLAVLGKEVLQRIKAIDFVIRGEGEEACPALLDELFSGKKRTAPIAGLCARSGKAVRCEPARLLEDIDHFFFLPSEVLAHSVNVSPDNLAILISSRGCPYRCAFCSSTALWQNRVRHHDVSLLIDYLKDLRATCGAMYFSLRDENFLANKRQVRAFTAALKREKLFYLFNAQGSVGLIDEVSAGQLAEAGCDQLQMGIETVSPRLQGLLVKKQSPEKIRAAIDILRRRLIRPFGYFIYGMGETEAESEENAAFIRTGGLLDAVASPLVHYPGTALSAAIDPALFFSAGEILYFDPAARQRYGGLYGKAIAFLSRHGAFVKQELNDRLLRHLPARIARYYHLLADGRQDAATALLLDLAAAEPGNPWPHALLEAYYEEAGERSKAATHRKKRDTLLYGGKR